MDNKLRSDFELELMKLNSTAFLLQEELNKIGDRRKEVLMALALFKALTPKPEMEENTDQTT